MTKMPTGQWAQAVAAVQVQMAQREASASASGGLVRAGPGRDAITAEPVEIIRARMRRWKTMTRTIGCIDELRSAAGV